MISTETTTADNGDVSSDHTMNFLMCASIADQLHQAYILGLVRSAGTMGCNLFEGARSRGAVPMYIDTTTTTAQEEQGHTNNNNTVTVTLLVPLI